MTSVSYNQQQISKTAKRNNVQSKSSSDHVHGISQQALALAHARVDKQENEIDYSKVLNSKCGCGKGLPWKKGTVVMAYPCEHMYHDSCFNKLKDNVCSLCSQHIAKKLTMLDEGLHHQRFADILSMTYYDDMSNTTPGKFIDSMFDLASVFARTLMTVDRVGAKVICEQIFLLNNLTLKVYGMDKLKLEQTKVFICNHVTNLDFVVIYYLLETGFLSSTTIGQIIIDKLKDVIPLLTFERGDTNRKRNIVDEMKRFVDVHGSICLFPEGLMKHPDVLIRFRTGAFHIGRPIYAITIRHNDIISDEYVNGFMYKLGGKRNINMEVHILGPYYPPFDEASIEMIRLDMAKHGNMVLSRVANRDVIDQKGTKFAS
jgi:hypothetical protein